ncbi:porin [Sulfitobacter guttiformis]|uniref:Porin-like protein n=1 Tax=Sulfitobacter guttiformis TaxID=74349 RepID=A0A420DTY9_9RHOB|nr:porin [Sulfitobacter guttiformis]KIN71169.1 Porin precursor [Sulfitobacter guttiformis KCTC 32187]RKE97643.1 porin-like protein [Sulfitobacter guttiformis]
MHPITRFAVPALLAFPSLATAQDTTPEWDFYGQLNLGVISVDNGTGSETGVTDNDNSNSRVGAIFRRDLDNGAQFRFHFESAIGLTGSSSINGEDNDLDLDYRRSELRKLEFVYQTATIGTFSFGQGSIATDGTAEADFSGTGVIAYSGISDLAANQSLTLADGSISGTRIGNAFSAFDGGRRFRVRYDTPEYNGFGFSVSAGEEVLARGNDDEFYDFGLSYNKDYGNYKVAARLGHSIRDSAEAFTLGSAAILHEPTGLSFALAAGQSREADTDYVYAKAGLQRDWLSIGRTYLSADYYSGSDFAFSGSDSESVGIAVVQKVDAYNVELYATYRTYDLDTAGSAFNDVDVTFVGARWKF